MERSERQERSDIVYIELDSTGAGGRVKGPAGTERDGERKREQSGRGEGGGRQEESRRCGGSGWMQEDCARRECERERAGIAGGGGGGFGATAMSVCTRTPSRPRRWRNVATQTAPQTQTGSDPL